ncbi:hypothetical protein HK405_010399, partial [Cladochytrium tenue]
ATYAPTIAELGRILKEQFRHMSPTTTYRDIVVYVDRLRGLPTTATEWRNAISNLERMRTEMINPSHYTDADLVCLVMSVMEPAMYSQVTQNVMMIHNSDAVRATALATSTAFGVDTGRLESDSEDGETPRGRSSTSTGPHSAPSSVSARALLNTIPRVGLLTSTEDITLDEL